VSNTQTQQGGMVTIAGKIPLSELNNYHSRIKSLTGGQGSYSMELSHYETVPPNIQAQIVAQHQPHEED
jgi:elongation factor G